MTTGWTVLRDGMWRSTHASFGVAFATAARLRAATESKAYTIATCELDDATAEKLARDEKRAAELEQWAAR